MRMKSDFAILAYFDAVAIVGIEALKSRFQVVLRLINRHDVSDSRGYFAGSVITNFPNFRLRRKNVPQGQLQFDS
jgi:hypothetical protein